MEADLSFLMDFAEKNRERYFNGGSISTYCHR